MKLRWERDGILIHSPTPTERPQRDYKAAHITKRDGDGRWALVLSYLIAPRDLKYQSLYDTEQEAKEAAENIVRVLIIGGHHGR